MPLLYLRDRILSLCLVLASAEAYTKFSPICSVPAAHVNFVSSPDSRGTLDILWNSLFMIIACTWTIQHLNVPEQRNGHDPGQIGDLKWKLKRFLQSAKWMVITMLAPEFIMGMAFYDLLWAKRCHRKLRGFASQDQVPWTLAYAWVPDGAWARRSWVGLLWPDSRSSGARRVSAVEMQMVGVRRVVGVTGQENRRECVVQVSVLSKPELRGLLWLRRYCQSALAVHWLEVGCGH